MTYAKLIDGEFVLAPKKLVVGDNTVYNPTADMLEADGWKEVVYTDPPVVEEGYIAVSGWQEEDNEIVQVWNIEPEGDIDADVALDILMGGE